MRSVGKRQRNVNPAQVYQGLFVSSANSALKRIHDDMDAAIRYVISSTWRESLSRARLGVVFRCAGLGVVADRLHEGETRCTPPEIGRIHRVLEIAQWLDRHHQGEPLVILDDTHSGASLLPTLIPAPTPPSNVPAPRHPSESAPHLFAGRVLLCNENVRLTSDYVSFNVAALRCAVLVARIAA